MSHFGFDCVKKHEFIGTLPVFPRHRLFEHQTITAGCQCIEKLNLKHEGFGQLLLLV